jgi:hypothetical protein
MKPETPTPVLIPILVVALMLALTGCESGDGGLSGTDQVAVDDYENLDFSLEHGGLTASDEEAAFGDGYLLRAEVLDAGEEVDDPVAADPEVLRLEAQAGEDDPADPGRPRPRFTFLRVTWGMLDGPVDSTGAEDESLDLVDWSGLLRVDRGIAIVRRVIRFERPYDHLVWPRLDRRTVAWISHTGLHFDGLLVEIIERPQDLASPEGDPLPPNRLHFETGPFSRTVAVADLPGLDEIVGVEPEGNAIHFTGFRLSDLDPCPKGFLSGIWHAADDSTGRFRGRWVGLHGALQGFLRGGWGYDDDGERVFVGKYISRHGRFRGFLEGSWSPDGEYGHGAFEGVWVDGAGMVEGVLGGRYVAPPTRPGGFLSGRWAADCDDEAVDEIR